MILLTMKYLLRNLEIELDPPTFPSFNDNRIINCYIKCIRDEHNNPAIFITSPPPFLDLYFIIDSAELWFLSFLLTLSPCGIFIQIALDKKPTLSLQEVS